MVCAWVLGDGIETKDDESRDVVPCALETGTQVVKEGDERDECGYEGDEEEELEAVGHQIFVSVGGRKQQK